MSFFQVCFAEITCNVCSIKIFSFAGMFSKLLRTADKFLQKLNLRRLKMGTIIEFLDRFGMVKSKEAMAKVILTIKVSSRKYQDGL